MNLMYNFLAVYSYLLLEVCMALRNVHFPHDDRYSHHSDMEMQQYEQYQQYDSYSSGGVVMRQSPRRSHLRARFHRNMDYSDAQYNYKCKCSCTKCKKPKPKPKPCCEEFCSTECVVQNNILVVPYPVPYMVFNKSATSEFPMPPKPTTLPSSTSTTTTSTTIQPPTTTEMTTTEMTTTEKTTHSTGPFFANYLKNNRYQILNSNRRRSMGNKDFRSQKFGRLPKYGIVPIPENLALSLMQQINKDQSDELLVVGGPAKN